MPSDDHNFCPLFRLMIIPDNIVVTISRIPKLGILICYLTCFGYEKKKPNSSRFRTHHWLPLSTIVTVMYCDGVDSDLTE